ncbi:MAG TPA: rhomboid family intramembrane serine protease [Verrucomicrobiae bacterium]|nr:rhomboid family intramembrane serine protease [Verrucomicrobiae bacterium]
MLEDRDYMRQPAYEGLRLSFTLALVIVNTAIFLAELAAFSTPRGAVFVDSYFALSVEGLRQGYIWQLLTFQFLHAGWLHLIFNMLAVFFFGRPVEMALGRGRFLTLYLSSGVIGGLCQMAAALVWPSFFGSAVVGASASACGLVAAFAVLNWWERFTLFIYFFPVTMRGRTLLWCSIGLAAGSIFLTPHSNIANVAHLGGILTGALFVRQIVQGHWHWPEWGSSSSHPAVPREFAVTRAGKGRFWRSAAGKSDEELPTDEFVKNEVDPILEKISAHGIQSLTAREREILEKARSKMAKR